MKTPARLLVPRSGIDGEPSEALPDVPYRGGEGDMEEQQGMGLAAELIVGTAGHIDHGKTSLVRALTGTHLDTLPEERDRGITIALGFTTLDLAADRRLAFIDVPGHERFVRTMIAGAQGVDAALLCVSADDGVMPQTREHLLILNLLGVSQGVVALTKVDLVDEEMLELAQDDLEELLEGTFLEGAPIVHVSAETGQGLDALKDVLGGLSNRERGDLSTFRLPVDRAFVRRGFGTVVTGTAWSGALSDGEVVTVLPEGEQVRVRGMQVHGQDVSKVQAGWRIALNLAGVSQAEVGRGTLVARGRVPCPHMIDVRYTHVSDDIELTDGAGVRLLLGTAEATGRLHFAADLDSVKAGEWTWAQLRLETPIPCLPGDPFVIRRTSPVDTLGGGVVVDPWAPRMSRKHRERHGKELNRLHRGEVGVWLERAGEAGLDEREWSARSAEDVGVVLGDRRLAELVVARLQGVLLEALTDYHGTHPLSLGAHRRELRRGRLGHLGDRVFDALVDRLGDTGHVVVQGALVRAAAFQVALNEDQRVLQVSIRKSFEQAGLSGLDVKALRKLHPDPEVEALLNLLEADGQLTAVPNMGWLATSALNELEQGLRGHFGRQSSMATSEFKEITGLSRKGAIPLLEWLDRQLITTRSGDDRIAGARLRNA